LLDFFAFPLGQGEKPKKFPLLIFNLQAAWFDQTI